VSAFPHLNDQGDAHMVDVTAKSITERSATARSRVSMSDEVITRLHAGDVPKGDALAVARIAAISATKKTSELIPLCHPLAIHGVDVNLVLDATGAEITVTVKTADRTGVEMEALTAASVGALALIDMVKSLDRLARIEYVELLEKKGGRTGHWIRSEHE
jgi:cyclic pyranopterin monophosphate synthase